MGQYLVHVFKYLLIQKNSFKGHSGDLRGEGKKLEDQTRRDKTQVPMIPKKKSLMRWTVKHNAVKYSFSLSIIALSQFLVNDQ